MSPVSTDEPAYPFRDLAGAVAYLLYIDLYAAAFYILTGVFCILSGLYKWRSGWPREVLNENPCANLLWVWVLGVLSTMYRRFVESCWTFSALKAPVFPSSIRSCSAHLYHADTRLVTPSALPEPLTFLSADLMLSAWVYFVWGMGMFWLLVVIQMMLHPSEQRRFSGTSCGIGAFLNPNHNPRPSPKLTYPSNLNPYPCVCLPLPFPYP